jgi:ubiquinone biosynthesis protein UbiJ
MLTTLVCAAIENALNLLLDKEPSLKLALDQVKHQTLAIEIRDCHTTYALTYTGQQFMLFNNYQEQAECRISALLETLPELKDPSVMTQLIRQDKLDLEGDLHLAQAYSGAFAKLDIDWAEHLSAYIGDAPAQLIVEKGQQTKACLSHSATTFAGTFTQLMQDELKVAIHPLELQQFKQHTRAIKQHAAQLEQRIEQLLNR